MDPRKKLDTKISSDFILIYQAAVAGNSTALEGLVEKKISMDVTDEKGLFTPSAVLASEENDAAVNLLLESGARRDFAAMGYASVGRVDKAEELRKQSGFSIKMLAIGAAMHSDKTYAEYLRLKYALRIEWLVFGAAYAGNTAYLDELKQHINEERYLRALIKGCILGSQHEKAVTILNEHSSSNNDVYLRAAIKAASRIGDVELLKQCINRIGENPLLLNDYYRIAAKSAAKGGHFEIAKECLKSTNEQYRKDKRLSCKLPSEFIQEVVKAGLLYGHSNHVYQHFKDLLNLDPKQFELSRLSGDKVTENFNELAKLAARRGDLVMVQDIYAKHKIDLTDVVLVMDGCNHFHNEKLLTRALAYIVDTSFSSALMQAAVKIGSDPVALASVRAVQQGWTSKFKNKCFADFKECQQKALQIRHLMTTYLFNFDQAEAFLGSAKLRDLLAHAAFQGKNQYDAFPESLLEGARNAIELTKQDMSDMLDKYMLYQAKVFVDKELDEYLKRNAYTYLSTQHYNRISSLKSACAETKSRNHLHQLIHYEFGIFKGEVIPEKDHTRPKHQQPLKNAATPSDDAYQTLERIDTDNRLTN